LRPESVQPLLAVGEEPAVERGAREDPATPVRLHVALAGELANQRATFGWAETRVRGVGDNVVTDDRHGFGGIGAHGHLL
jgi:hypothetical protein